MTFMQARSRATCSRPRSSACALQRRKGELVDRARAVAQVFELAREERDVWVNQPARVAAVMATELEVDTYELDTALERHVRDRRAERAQIGPNLR